MDSRSFLTAFFIRAHFQTFSDIPRQSSKPARVAGPTSKFVGQQNSRIVRWLRSHAKCFQLFENHFSQSTLLKFINLHPIFGLSLF